MISSYDYLVIGFYFVFMLAIGFVFRHFSKDSSDYFRGGGSMLWWMCGASAFMVNFSAWSFTGAAGEIYESGTMILCLFFANAVAYLIAFYFTSFRYRQMRTITYAEAVRNRFGRGNEQFYIWIQVPIFILNGAVYLNAIGVFMHAVFGASLATIIVLLGIVVTLMSISGGAWAVVASDFVQMLIIATITVTAAFLALSHEKVGGLAGLIEKVPRHHFDWSELIRIEVLIVWVVALLLSQTLDANNMARGASRFLMVKNGRHAQWATLVPLIGMLLFPVFWLIPPMAATMMDLDLAKQFHDLPNPSETAYVAVSLTTMPKGLIGLLVCGIFAATMSTMDSGLNRSAGVFVRNFYLPVLKPDASESRQLWVGKAMTAALGTITIAAGLLMSNSREVGLFQLVLQIAARIEIPLIVPMLLGMFVKRTPSWSAWSTVLVGLGVAWGIHFCVEWNPTWLHAMVSGPALSIREAENLEYGVTVFAVVAIATSWYFLTGLWYTRSTQHYRDSVDEFFETMNKPIDPILDQVPDHEYTQYNTLGLLCMIYGGFVLLLIAIPNSATGRLCFLFCGGSVFLIGAALYWKARRIVRHK